MVSSLYTDISYDQGLAPAFAENSIPVAFAANNQFAPYFAACFRSLVDHTSERYNYDVVLIHTDMSAENMERLSAITRAHNNISLRFYQAKELIKQYDLKAGAHISVETYYRFLIQRVFPEYDKVLYMDCDLIVNADVAELFHTDVQGYLLAAARDPEFLGHLNGADPKIQKYILNDLGMRDPSNYFQAGVLLFNESEMRKAYSIEQWLTFASKPYRYNDQDVLNIYCEGRVKYFGMEWNMLTDCDHTRVSHVISHAPENIQQEYFEAHRAPKIIHYAGFRKPWHKPTEDMAQYFWQAMARTPYYEEALYSMMQFAACERILEDRKCRSPCWKFRRLAKKLLGRK